MTIQQIKTYQLGLSALSNSVHKRVYIGQNSGMSRLGVTKLKSSVFSVGLRGNILVLSRA